VYMFYDYLFVLYCTAIQPFGCKNSINDDDDDDDDDDDEDCVQYFFMLYSVGHCVGIPVESLPTLISCGLGWLL